MPRTGPPAKANVQTTSIENGSSSEPQVDKEAAIKGIWTLGITAAEKGGEENALVKKKEIDESGSESESSSIISFNEDSSDFEDSSINSSSSSTSSASDSSSSKKMDYAQRVQLAENFLDYAMRKSAKNNAACGPGKALSYCMGPTLILGGVGAMAFTIYTIVRELEYGGKISPESAGLHSFMAISGAIFAIAGSLCTYESCKN
jgi:hypothetical protein